MSCSNNGKGTTSLEASVDKSAIEICTGDYKYTEIMHELERKGFSNITTIGRQDIDKGSAWSNLEKVYEIEINGDKYFDENTLFSKDSEIILRYHDCKYEYCYSLKVNKHGTIRYILIDTDGGELVYVNAMNSTYKKCKYDGNFDEYETVSCSFPNDPQYETIYALKQKNNTSVSVLRKIANNIYVDGKVATDENGNELYDPNDTHDLDELMKEADMYSGIKYLN